jgi:hypothetical protein
MGGFFRRRKMLAAENRRQRVFVIGFRCRLPEYAAAVQGSDVIEFFKFYVFFF